MLTRPRRMAAITLTLFLLVIPTALYAQTAPNPPDESKPSAPTLTLNHEARAVEVSWASHVPSGRGIKWEVWVWTKKDDWQRLDDGNLSITRITHTGLESGVEYWYTYRVLYGNRVGEWASYGNIVFRDDAPIETSAPMFTPTPTPTSTPVFTVTPMPTSTPATFVAPTVTVELAGQDVLIKWNEVPGATHYEFACWCGSGKWETVTVWEFPSDGTYFRVFPSRTYHFAIRAWNDQGDYTEWSEHAIITTPSVFPTKTPVPYPTSTPTITPVPSTAYGKWLPGITIAPEHSEHECSLYSERSYGFSRRSSAAKVLRDNIIDSMGGRIYDPWIGQYFGIEQVTIDHVVEARHGHRSGLCHSSRKQDRGKFMHDPENAVLVSFRHETGWNRHERGIAAWLPDMNQCWYVNQVVHIKRKYGLTMDKPEADVAVDVLSGCSSVEMVFTNSPTPTPTIVTNDPLRMYDDNGDGHISCQEARNHGIAPVYSVHPAYQYMSDPDGNGIACE